MTKIKGWRNKFIKSKETSPPDCDGEVYTSFIISVVFFLSCNGNDILTWNQYNTFVSDSLLPNDTLKSLYSSSPKGLQKNLSAFCSNMLDEYLESEAQQISERAAAFSTNPEGSVAYQLPAKSSSYVKTLDSVLKHRNTASKFPSGANRPCPLSHKPLLYSALMSPAPPLARPATPQYIQQSTSPNTHPGTLLTAGANAASGSSCTTAVSQR